ALIRDMSSEEGRALCEKRETPHQPLSTLNPPSILIPPRDPAMTTVLMLAKDNGSMHRLDYLQGKRYFRAVLRGYSCVLADRRTALVLFLGTLVYWYFGIMGTIKITAKLDTEKILPKDTPIHRPNRLVENIVWAEYYPVTIIVNNPVDVRDVDRLNETCLWTLFCMAIVCAIFIQNPISVIMATTAIASISLGVMGYLSFWHLDLDPVSLCAVLISIGMAVDFVAHTTYHYQ
ncbi:hypothetical protein TELCIR_19361, partial [Teladorsagia circumcincta]